MALTVAVTGPTGELGRSTVAALEREDEVEAILAMARRPFDPLEQGWRKTHYRRGDILDRAAVDGLVADADVVVHLAFLIMGNRREAQRINVMGARHVFAATVAAGRPRRLVYTSSIAAYGFARAHTRPVTEDEPVSDDDELYYARQKAAVERVLHRATAGSALEVYVLRPCVIAGPDATLLADFMPWNRIGGWGSRRWRLAADRVAALRPPFPDPGFRLQLVHHDDVAAALVAAALGRGAPGPYNIAGDGAVTFADAVRAVGGRPFRVPRSAADLAARAVAQVPATPSLLDWIRVSRHSLIVDTSRAKQQLGWRPQHTTQETLTELAAAVRERDRPGT